MLIVPLPLPPPTPIPRWFDVSLWVLVAVSTGHLAWNAPRIFNPSGMNAWEWLTARLASTDRRAASHRDSAPRS